MRKTILIEGMSCGHCAAAVEAALKELPGVEAAAVDLKAKSAAVELAAEVSDASLKAAVEQAGYRATNL